MNQPTPTPAANPEQPEIWRCPDCKQVGHSPGEPCIITPPTPTVIAPSAETCPVCGKGDLPEGRPTHGHCLRKLPAPSAGTASEIEIEQAIKHRQWQIRGTLLKEVKAELTQAQADPKSHPEGE